MSIRGILKASTEYWKGAAQTLVNPVGGVARMTRGVLSGVAETVDTYAPGLVDAISQTARAIHLDEIDRNESSPCGSKRLISIGDKLLKTRPERNHPEYGAYLLALATTGFRYISARNVAAAVDTYALTFGYQVDYPALVSKPELAGLPLTQRMPNVWAQDFSFNPKVFPQTLLPSYHVLAGFRSDADPLLLVGQNTRDALFARLGNKKAEKTCKELMGHIQQAVGTPIEPHSPDGDRTRRWYMFYHLGYIFDPKGAEKGENQHTRQVVFDLGHNPRHFRDGVVEYAKGHPIDAVFALNNGNPEDFEDH